MEGKLRLLVVDDHNVMRKGLVALLRSSRYGLEVVAEAGAGPEAVTLAQELMPDIILMDLVMPGMDGIQATRQILEHTPGARILVLTSFAQQARVAEALQAGALGYLLKDASPDDLVNAIRSVAAGQVAVPRSLMPASLLPPMQRSDAAPISPEALTERERQVVLCITRGLTNQQIGAELSIGLNTVRSHVSNILRKLDLENRTQIARYGRTLE